MTLSGKVHKCPGCARPSVPNRLFACGPCWGRLPRDLKQPIIRSANLPLTEDVRFDAVSDALRWYEENK